MLRGLATVSFFAADVEEAKRWYTELLEHEPYFARPLPPDPAAYVEFRIGDYEHELGIIDAKYAPSSGAGGPAGAVVFWHVDDLPAALERATSMGATQHDPLTEREAGFATASVIDPFGNILGLMRNPHYLDILAAGKADDAA